MCTSNQFWGCSRQGSPEHIVNPIQSARLRSDKSFNFKYGKMEVRAKMPKGDWIWPGACFNFSVGKFLYLGGGGCRICNFQNIRLLKIMFVILFL